jgi:hypothetical protein
VTRPLDGDDLETILAALSDGLVSKREGKWEAFAVALTEPGSVVVVIAGR